VLVCKRTLLASSQDRRLCAHLGHRAIAVPGLEAAIRALRLDRRRNCRTMSISENPVRRPDARPMRPARRRGQTMRVMVLVKATDDSEKGISPTTETTELFEAMGKYNEELVNAGIMLAGDGLKPSSQGKRVAFDGPRRTVIDGPFAETRELVAGFWLWEVKDMDEAVAWVKRCPNPMPGPSEIEIRPLYEMADLRDILTPEAAELHGQTREEPSGD
jgi:hypothetical protein